NELAPQDTSSSALTEEEAPQKASNSTELEATVVHLPSSDESLRSLEELIGDYACQWEIWIHRKGADPKVHSATLIDKKSLNSNGYYKALIYAAPTHGMPINFLDVNHIWIEHYSKGKSHFNVYEKEFRETH